MDASRMDLLMPTFNTTNYKNDHHGRVMMIPSEFIEGAKVVCPAQPLYKEYMGEADDDKAQVLKDEVLKCANDYDAVLQDGTATLDEQQKALMMQAYTLHLHHKMVI